MVMLLNVATSYFLPALGYDAVRRLPNRMKAGGFSADGSGATRWKVQRLDDKSARSRMAQNVCSYPYRGMRSPTNDVGVRSTLRTTVAMRWLASPVN